MAGAGLLVALVTTYGRQKVAETGADLAARTDVNEAIPRRSSRDSATITLQVG